MRFFVFVDTPYCPYVDDVLEAESLEAAERVVAEQLTPGAEETIYLVPAESVTPVRAYGAKPQPRGLLKLLADSNRAHGAMLDAKDLSGGFSVTMEPVR